MRFALHFLIIMVATLSACGVTGQILSVSLEQNSELCRSFEVRSDQSRSVRPFTNLLATECRAAAQQVEMNDNVLSAWYAKEFIQRMTDLKSAISTLDRQPTHSGEFLIAREVEVLDALQDWIRARKTAEIQDLKNAE